MKYRFIDEQRRYHGVEKMAGLLAVSRAGYYAWSKRPKSARASSDEELVKRIEKIQKRVKYRYGSPRGSFTAPSLGCPDGKPECNFRGMDEHVTTL